MRSLILGSNSTSWTSGTQIVRCCLTLPQNGKMPTQPWNNFTRRVCKIRIACKGLTSLIWKNRKTKLKEQQLTRSNKLIYPETSIIQMLREQQQQLRVRSKSMKQVWMTTTIKDKWRMTIKICLKCPTIKTVIFTLKSHQLKSNQIHWLKIPAQK